MTATKALLAIALTGLVGCGGDLTLPSPSGEGVVLSIVTTIGFLTLQFALLRSAQEEDAGGMEIGRMMSGLGMTSSCVQSISRALLVAAIFVGRNQLPREPEDGPARTE